MLIRDRIKELRRVPASELIPNPRNWRTHPTAQQDTLRGVLAEIGFADAVLAYETPHGLQLIDGHARAEISTGGIIPVLILDVTQDEADKLLATLDPLAAMAGADAGKLDDLLGTLETQSQAVADLFESLRDQYGVFAVELGKLPDLPTGDRGGYQTMSFSLTDEQAEQIKAALQLAKDGGPFPDTGNPNANGNALAKIAERFLGA